MEKIEASHIAAILAAKIDKVYLKFDKVIPKSFLSVLKRELLQTILKTLLKYDLIQNKKPEDYQSYYTSEIISDIFEK